MAQSTENSRIIRAPAFKIFQTLTDPSAIETWQVPGNMTGKVYNFDLREGGSYTMSIFYPEDAGGDGKTSVNEDRFTSTFVKIDEPHKLIQLVEFDTDDPDFVGKMTVEVTLEPIGDQTKVTFIFNDIPSGIRPEDNEEGTISSLEKLAEYVEG